MAKRIIKYEIRNYEISFDETDELKQKVYEAVLAWYVKHESFSGETILQSDDPIIDAPNVLSDIADDLFKFEENLND